MLTRKHPTANLFILLLAATLFICPAGASTGATTLLLSGTAEIRGAAAAFDMVITPQASWRNRIDGPLSLLSGFDGKVFWRLENGAGPFELDFAEREVWTALHWVLSGYWQDGRAPLSWSIDARTGKRRFRLGQGRLQFEVTDSPGPAKPDWPTRLLAVNAPQEMAIDFSGSQQLAARTLPRRIVISGIGQVDAFTIETASLVADPDPAGFQKPALKLANTRYLTGVASDIEVKQAASGHLFVKPSINGEKVGWFLFDSGASASMLTQPLIDRFALQPLGEAISGGIGGATGYVALYQGGEVPVINSTLDWFRVGGHTSQQVPVRLSTGADYEADLYAYGFLGGAVVQPFRVQLDYRRNRVGFIYRSDPAD